MCTYSIIDGGILPVEDFIKCTPLSLHHVTIDPLRWELETLSLKEILTRSESFE